jgi:hypothetical protein
MVRQACDIQFFGRTTGSMSLARCGHERLPGLTAGTLNL